MRNHNPGELCGATEKQLTGGVHSLDRLSGDFTFIALSFLKIDNTILFRHNDIMPSRTSTYKADLAGVSLKPTESQVVASWMLSSEAKADPEGSWKRMVFEQNEVQIRGRSTLRRQSNLLKSRLSHLSPEALTLLLEGSYLEKVQVCFVAALRHSQFLGDFVQEVVGGLWKRRQRAMTNYDWQGFLETCRAKDSKMGVWTSSTEDRIKTAVFSILREVGLLKRGKPFEIQSFCPEATVIALLEQENDKYCLDCLKVTS